MHGGQANVSLFLVWNSHWLWRWGDFNRSRPLLECSNYSDLQRYVECLVHEAFAAYLKHFKCTEMAVER